MRMHTRDLSDIVSLALMTEKRIIQLWKREHRMLSGLESGNEIPDIKCNHT